MVTRTIQIYAKSAFKIVTESGGATSQSDIIGAGLNGDSFSWENPNDVKFTVPAETVSLTFDDSDGELTDDPFSGSNVVDQQLSEEVTINGKTYSPSEETVRWESNPPVNVENEYEITLFDDDGNTYRMVGVSITEGYNTEVVGIMFDGPQPPPRNHAALQAGRIHLQRHWAERHDPRRVNLLSRGDTYRNACRTCCGGNATRRRQDPDTGWRREIAALDRIQHPARTRASRTHSHPGRGDWQQS